MIDYADFQKAILKFKKEPFNINEGLILLQKIRIFYEIKKDLQVLKLAIEFSNYCYSKNELNSRILLFKAYFTFIDGRDETEALKVSKVVNSGAKYYKVNDVEVYFALNYIKARFVSNKRSKEKIIKEFIELSKTYEIANVYIGDILLNDDDFDDAMVYFNKAYQNGNRSSLLYENLYKYFIKTKDDGKTNTLFPLIRWLICRKIDYEKLINFQIDKIVQIADYDVDIAILIYESTQNDELLFNITKFFITHDDVSKKAWDFYFLANKKQLMIDGLNKIFIRASFNNDYENISYFFMSTYLKENELTDDIKGYIFHTLINNEHLISLIDTNLESFYKYVISILYDKTFDSFKLSAFKYVLLNKEKFDFNDNDIKTIENIVFEHLFLYKIDVLNQNNTSNEIIIIETDKTSVSTYPIENNTVYIKSASSEFSYYLHNDRNSIACENIKITPMVYSFEIDIYLYFYENSYYDDDLFIRLSKYYFEEKYEYDDMVDIFTKTLLIDNISDLMKVKLNTYLASIHVLNKDYNSAVKNIDDLAYHNLSSSFLEKMVLAYLKTNNIKKVYLIVNLNYYKISENMIIQILEHIKTDEDLKLFSSIFYKTFKNGSNNLNLLNVVLKHYDFTFLEQLEMIEVCQKRNVFVKSFYENLVKNAMDKRVFNKQIEDSFLYLYKNTQDVKLYEKYIIFIFYQIIKNDYTINKQTLDFIIDNRKLSNFSYYIIFLYFNNFGHDNIEVFNETLSFFESENIIIPSDNKMCKHYDGLSFFRKYKPFSYIADSSKTVFLNYKIDGGKYEKIQMEYFHFSMFLTKIVLFYGEEVEYYFSEVSVNGSIDSKKLRYKENNDLIIKNITDDFDLINNALIFASKYLMKDTEDTLENLLHSEKPFTGQII